MITSSFSASTQSGASLEESAEVSSPSPSVSQSNSSPVASGLPPLHPDASESQSSAPAVSVDPSAPISNVHDEQLDDDAETNKDDTPAASASAISKPSTPTASPDAKSTEANEEAASSLANASSGETMAPQTPREGNRAKSVSTTTVSPIRSPIDVTASDFPDAEQPSNADANADPTADATETVNAAAATAEEDATTLPPLALPEDSSNTSSTSNASPSAASTLAARTPSPAKATLSRPSRSPPSAPSSTAGSATPSDTPSAAASPKESPRPSVAVTSEGADALRIEKPSTESATTPADESSSAANDAAPSSKPRSASSGGFTPLVSRDDGEFRGPLPFQMFSSPQVKKPAGSSKVIVPESASTLASTSARGRSTDPATTTAATSAAISAATSASTPAAKRPPTTPSGGLSNLTRPTLSSSRKTVNTRTTTLSAVEKPNFNTSLKRSSSLANSPRATPRAARSMSVTAAASPVAASPPPPAPTTPPPQTPKVIVPRPWRNAAATPQSVPPPPPPANNRRVITPDRPMVTPDRSRQAPVAASFESPEAPLVLSPPLEMNGHATPSVDGHPEVGRSANSPLLESMNASFISEDSQDEQTSTPIGTRITEDNAQYIHSTVKSPNRKPIVKVDVQKINEEFDAVTSPVLEHLQTVMKDVSLDADDDDLTIAHANTGIPFKKDIQSRLSLSPVHIRSPLRSARSPSTFQDTSFSNRSASSYSSSGDRFPPFSPPKASTPSGSTLAQDESAPDVSVHDTAAQDSSTVYETPFDEPTQEFPAQDSIYATPASVAPPASATMRRGRSHSTLESRGTQTQGPAPLPRVASLQRRRSVQPSDMLPASKFIPGAGHTRDWVSVTDKSIQQRIPEQAAALSVYTTTTITVPVPTALPSKSPRSPTKPDASADAKTQNTNLPPGVTIAVPVPSSRQPRTLRSASATQIRVPAAAVRPPSVPFSSTLNGAPSSTLFGKGSTAGPHPLRQSSRTNEQIDHLEIERAIRLGKRVGLRTGVRSKEEAEEVQIQAGERLYNRSMATLERLNARRNAPPSPKPVFVNPKSRVLGEAVPYLQGLNKEELPDGLVENDYDNRPVVSDRAMALYMQAKASEQRKREYAQKLMSRTCPFAPTITRKAESLGPGDRARHFSSSLTNNLKSLMTQQLQEDKVTQGAIVEIADALDRMEGADGNGNTGHRLYEYAKIYDRRKVLLEERMLSDKATFRPNLTKKSLDIANRTRSLGATRPLHQRKHTHEEMERKKKEYETMGCTFQPQLISKLPKATMRYSSTVGGIPAAGHGVGLGTTEGAQLNDISSPGATFNFTQEEGFAATEDAGQLQAATANTPMYSTTSFNLVRQGVRVEDRLTALGRITKEKVELQRKAIEEKELSNMRRPGISKRTLELSARRSFSLNARLGESLDPLAAAASATAFVPPTTPMDHETVSGYEAMRAGATDVVSRLYAEAKATELRLQQKRQELQRLEQEKLERDVTFHPQVSVTTQLLAERIRSKRLEQFADVQVGVDENVSVASGKSNASAKPDLFTYLSKEGRNLEALERQKEAEVMAQCSFHPNNSIPAPVIASKTGYSPSPVARRGSVTSIASAGSAASASRIPQPRASSHTPGSTTTRRMSLPRTPVVPFDAHRR